MRFDINIPPASKMKPEFDFPLFNEHFPELSLFIESLVQEYLSGNISSWSALQEKVNFFFTLERMEKMDRLVPGWRKMASYFDGVTLTHVICVFLGLVMLPEFQDLPREQQELVKWMVLFHDMEKEVKEGERDPKHGFRSAVTAARQLPHLGFNITATHDHLIASWSEFTYSAMKVSESCPKSIQDNEKLPGILAGIDRMFGENTPAGLIIKGVLLHMSITTISAWPPTAPLMDTEIKKYISRDLLPLLKVMMLADNDGWAMFHPGRQQQRTETLEAFQSIEKIIFQ